MPMQVSRLLYYSADSDFHTLDQSNYTNLMETLATANPNRLIVKNNSIEVVNGVTIFYEKLKGALGGTNRAQKELINYELMKLLRYGEEQCFTDDQVKELTKKVKKNLGKNYQQAIELIDVALPAAAERREKLSEAIKNYHSSNIEIFQKAPFPPNIDDAGKIWNKARQLFSKKEMEVKKSDWNDILTMINEAEKTEIVKNQMISHLKIRALLSEIALLAQEGRFDEAIHLLRETEKTVKSEGLDHVIVVPAPIKGLYKASKSLEEGHESSDIHAKIQIWKQALEDLRSESDSFAKFKLMLSLNKAIAEKSLESFDNEIARISYQNIAEQSKDPVDKIDAYYHLALLAKKDSHDNGDVCRTEIKKLVNILNTLDLSTKEKVTTSYKSNGEYHALLGEYFLETGKAKKLSGDSEWKMLIDQAVTECGAAVTLAENVKEFRRFWIKALILADRNEEATKAFSGPPHMTALDAVEHKKMSDFYLKQAEAESSSEAKIRSYENAVAHCQEAIQKGEALSNPQKGEILRLQGESETKLAALYREQQTAQGKSNELYRNAFFHLQEANNLFSSKDRQALRSLVIAGLEAEKIEQVVQMIENSGLTFPEKEDFVSLRATKAKEYLDLMEKENIEGVRRCFAKAKLLDPTISDMRLSAELIKHHEFISDQKLFSTMFSPQQIADFESKSLEKASESAKLQDWKRVKTECEQILCLSKGSGETHYLLGMAYSHMADGLEKALKHLYIAATTNPNDFKYSIELAKAYEKDGDKKLFMNTTSEAQESWKQADKYFDNVMRKRPLAAPLTAPVAPQPAPAVAPVIVNIMSPGQNPLSVPGQNQLPIAENKPAGQIQQPTINDDRDYYQFLNKYSNLNKLMGNKEELVENYEKIALLLNDPNQQPWIGQLQANLQNQLSGLIKEQKKLLTELGKAEQEKNKETKNFAKAIKYYEKAVKLCMAQVGAPEAPQSAEDIAVKKSLALLYEEQGEWTKAVEQYKFIPLGQIDFETTYHMGWILYNRTGKENPPDRTTGLPPKNPYLDEAIAIALDPQNGALVKAKTPQQILDCKILLAKLHLARSYVPTNQDPQSDLSKSVNYFKEACELSLKDLSTTIHDVDSFKSDLLNAVTQRKKEIEHTPIFHKDAQVHRPMDIEQKTFARLTVQNAVLPAVIQPGDINEATQMTYDTIRLGRNAAFQATYNLIKMKGFSPDVAKAAAKAATDFFFDAERIENATIAANSAGVRDIIHNFPDIRHLEQQHKNAIADAGALAAAKAAAEEKSLEEIANDTAAAVKTKLEAIQGVFLPNQAWFGVESSNERIARVSKAIGEVMKDKGIVITLKDQQRPIYTDIQELLEKAVEKFNDDPSIVNARLNLEYSSGLVDQVRAHLKNDKTPKNDRSVEIDVLMAKSSLDITTLDEKMGMKQALDALDTAAEKLDKAPNNEENSKYRLELAKMYFTLYEKTETYSSFTTPLQKDVGGYKILLEKALREAKKAPRSEEKHALLSKIYILKNDFEQAIPNLQTAITLGANSDDIKKYREDLSIITPKYNSWFSAGGWVERNLNPFRLTEYYPENKS